MIQRILSSSDGPNYSLRPGSNSVISAAAPTSSSFMVGWLIHATVLPPPKMSVSRLGRALERHDQVDANAFTGAISRRL